MNVLDQLKRIERIGFLINSKTASMEELSKKFNISAKELKKIFKIMKHIGAPLKYDRKKKRYYFTENKKIVYGWM